MFRSTSEQYNLKYIIPKHHSNTSNIRQSCRNVYVRLMKNWFVLEFIFILVLYMILGAFQDNPTSWCQQFGFCIHFLILTGLKKQGSSRIKILFESCSLERQTKYSESFISNHIKVEFSPLIFPFSSLPSAHTVLFVLLSL